MQSYIFFRNQTTIPQIFTVATAENILPQIARIFTEPLAWEEAPTDCTDFHEFGLVRRCSHRLHRSTQMVRLRRCSHGIHGSHRTTCLRRTSHRFHGFSQMLTSGGALVSSAPSKIRCCTSCLVGALETSAPPERHPNNLCRSVKSVGEYSQQELL